MSHGVSLTGASSPIQLNMFERLSDEIIQDRIACYLSPKNGLSARLVDRRFAVLFGDNHVWRTCYRALCSDPQKPLFKPSEILTACVNDSSLVREEAHRALILWVTNQQ